MQSKASTVAAYLAELPPERRKAIAAVRKVVLENLDKKGGLQEAMQYGMIGYSLSHRAYPAGYHCDPKQPLPFASLASQKNHIALYLFCIYSSEEDRARFEAEWKATGKKLDMGKGCVRFKKLEDIPLEVVARAIKRATAKRFVAHYEAAIKPGGGARGKRPAPAKKPAPARSKPARGKSEARPRRAAPRARPRASKA